MIEYGVIAVLVLVIIVMTWVWYIEPKRKTSKFNSTLESLKDEFTKDNHALIDSIVEYEYAYDACKVLLIHIETLNDKQKLLEVEVEEYEVVHAKVSEGLDKKSHEIIHISHQMRTSLSGLLGFTHFLQSTQMTDEQEEFVSIISTSSNELLTLVNSIIDMTPSTRREGSRDIVAVPSVTPQVKEEVKNEIPYVLVVDDNEINKRLLAKVLENENLEVSYASNGQEAVKLRKDNHFDIIFMDIQMPVMDGVEASKAIRKYEDEENIAPVSIIALTANTGKDDRDTYLDAGMTDYMAKPIMIDDIRRKIAQL